MQIAIAPELLTGFLFALARASAWIVITPPFSSAAVPLRVKIGISASLALLLADDLPPGTTAFELWPFIAGLGYQVLTGLALGFVVMLLFAAVQAGGEMIDFFAGFSSASVYDPFSNAPASPFGRLYQLLAVSILFSFNGHVMLVRGFVESFQAAPLEGMRFESLADLLTHDLLGFVVSAVQIAAPLLVALFLTEVALGLLARSAPQTNLLALGFGVKTLVAILLVGVALPLLPGAVDNLLERILIHTTFLGGG